jgi:hypothetical protein
MALDFQIRRAEPDDRPALTSLLSAWMPGRDIAARLRWLYEENPHGPARTWLALDDGQVVGCASLFPRRFWVGEGYALGAIGGDAFVLPSHRRRGIARALHATSRSGMLEEGISFMFGPPRPENLEALKKAGSEVVGRLHHLTLPLRPAAFGRLLAPGAAPKALSGFLEAAFAVVNRLRVRGRGPGQLLADPPLDHRFDELWRRAGKTPAVRGVRDADYLAWRYRGHDSAPQSLIALAAGEEILGYAVLERHGARAALVDFLARQDSEAEGALLAAAIGHAYDWGAATLVTRWNLRGPFGALLLRHGFLPGRTPMYYQVLRAGGTQPGRDPLLAPRRWQLSYGDEDLEALDFLEGSGDL